MAREPVGAVRTCIWDVLLFVVFITKVPSETVTPPVWVSVPARMTVPGPDLVMRAFPETALLRIRMPLLMALKLAGSLIDMGPTMKLVPVLPVRMAPLSSWICLFNLLVALVSWRVAPVWTWTVALLLPRPVVLPSMLKVPLWMSTVPNNGSTVALTMPIVFAPVLTRLWAEPFMRRLAVAESPVMPFGEPTSQRLLAELPPLGNPEVTEGAPKTVSPASVTRARARPILPPLL